MCLFDAKPVPVLNKHLPFIMMPHKKWSLCSLLILSLVVLRMAVWAVVSHPLMQKGPIEPWLIHNEHVMMGLAAGITAGIGLPNPGEIVGSGAKVERPVMEMRHHVVKHSLDSVSKLTNVEIIIDTELQCVAHHEFAVFHPSENYTDADMVQRSCRRFMNRRNEIRYYYCRSCRLCPPGVRVISTCHKKRDILCSTHQCINPDHVFDPVQQECYPPIASTVPAIAVPTVPASTKDFQIFRSDKSGHGIEDDMQLPMATTTPPLLEPNSNTFMIQVTIITIGVVSLNAVVIAIAATYLRKRVSGKIRTDRSIPLRNTPDCFNNCMSIPHQLGSSQRQTVGSSRRKQENDRTSSAPAEINAATPEINRVFSQDLDQAESSLPLYSHSSKRVKENNLNIVCDSVDEQREQTDLLASNEETNLNGISVLSGKTPYWLVMMGHFGPEGGVLSCDDSDVVLEIPPGAIPAHLTNQLIKAKISLCPDIIAPELTDPECLWLTPLVDFESPGLNKFNKDVLIRLPHYARIEPGWTFRMHYTDPTAATKSQDTQADSPLLDDNSGPWFVVKQKGHINTSGKSSRKDSEQHVDVTFTVDDKYINVSTTHFSKYVCSGCHKEHPLHLEAVVYAKHTKVKGHEQMDLNVYIIDPIKDFLRMVQESEGNSMPHTQNYPLILNYKKKSKETSFLEICLQEKSMPDDWKWRLETYNGDLPAKRVIPIQSLIRCCSTLRPFLQTYCLQPKVLSEGEPLSIFRAMISIGQQNGKVEPTPIPITVPLAVKDDGKNYDRVNNNINVKGTVVTDDQIYIVVKQLPIKNWRPLYRKLMGSGADNEIDCIITQDPNNANEQKHQALISWRRSRGQHATVEKLAQALDSIGLAEIAQCLQGDEENVDERPMKLIEDKFYETTI